MPTLTSFGASNGKLYQNSLQHEINQQGEQRIPYSSSTLEMSPRTSPAYSNVTAAKQPISQQARHVTFSSPAKSGVKQEFTVEPRPKATYAAASPVYQNTCNPPRYESLFHESGGLYTSRPRSMEDDDGNTTTSGSYVVESDNMDDSIIST